MSGLFGRGRERVQASTKSSLERICKEYGRPDLYEPLKWTLPCDPRSVDAEKFLLSGSPIKEAVGYFLHGSVMLYKSNIDSAKHDFETALNMCMARKEYLEMVIDDIKAVADIATRWWREEGMYEPLPREETL